MQTYSKFIVGVFCLVLIVSGTTQAQAVSKTDKNFNSDIYKIQKILATDSSIYPEGKRTGILDEPTSDAIARFSELLNTVQSLLVVDLLGEVQIAREKGKEASVKATLSSLRATAEIHYDENDNSYKGFCKSRHVSTAKSNLKKLKSTFVCTDSASEYQVSATLGGGKTYFCADSTGFASTLSKKPNKGSVACK